MYAALSTLPDDYYVIHSYRMVSVKENSLQEREADFVVFHPELGILCIEAKAGKVHYENDTWYYANGKPMKRGGPYEQASSLKYNIRDRFYDCGCKDLINSCKIAFAVWFPSLSERLLGRINLASDADRAITLTCDDLANPEPAIRRIFDIDVHGKKTNLTSNQARRIVERVLCPALNITPTARLEYEVAENSFIRLLDSQAVILDFMEGQRSAAIRGAAGTGKTLIAVEYAMRMSDKGEKTLYLCRTGMLAKDIRNRVEKHKNADAHNIDSLAEMYGMKSGSVHEKCAALAAEFYDMLGSTSFEYQHVIIDEGQDFGEDYIAENELIELLYDLVTIHKNGTLYIFYDDRQKSSSKALPEFIQNVDCKLTLHVNCRNSRDIAECAIRGADVSFKQDPRYRAAGVPVGSKPQLFVSSSAREQRDYINKRIAQLREMGLEDITIVTCKTIEGSALKGYKTSRRGNVTWENTGIPFTTYTKFKGMESEAVILVDVDASVWKLNDYGSWYAIESSLENESEYQIDKRFTQWLETRTEPAFSDAFYIAASRAKFELSIVCDMFESDCEKLVRMLCGNPGRKPANKLAKLLKAENVS